MSPLLLLIAATLSILPAEAYNFGVDCVCTSDRSPGLCAMRMAGIRRTVGFNQLNPGLTVNGNPCNAAVGHGLQFMCCKSCCDLFGGVNQARKSVDFVGLAATRACQDQTHMTTWCRSASLAANFQTNCQRGKWGWPGYGVWSTRCAATCGFCTAATQAVIFNLQNACEPFADCRNTSDCNAPALTTFQCTHTGAVPRPDDLANADATLRYGRWGNSGECNCATCTYGNNACTSDTDCGGLPHACQAVNGTCDCSGCILNNFCTSDRDCGGFVGACMYVSQTAAVLNLPFRCQATGRGINNEACSCLWCPDNTQPCHSHGVATDCGNAATVCGALEHCYITTDANVNAASTSARCQAATIPTEACTCGCRPSTAVTEAEAAATTTVYAVTNKGPGLCVQNTPCYFAAAGAVCGELPVAGWTACVQTNTLTTPCADTAATAACYCNCANLGILAMPPSECEGLIMNTLGVHQACTMGGVEGQCAFEAAGTTFGMRSINMCKPDASSQQCQCGSRIDAKWSAYVGLACITSAQCQDAARTSDLQAVCNTATGLCVLATAQAVAGEVYGSASAAYVAAVIAPCTIDADCGWGTCVTADFTAACAGQTNCRCQAAGCFTASGTGTARLYQPCGFDISTTTCGGLSNACVGNCYTDATTNLCVG